MNLISQVLYSLDLDLLVRRTASEAQMGFRGPRTTCFREDPTICFRFGLLHG